MAERRLPRIPVLALTSRMKIRGFRINLDSDDLRLIPDSGTGDFPYSVSPHDPEGFLLHFMTLHSYVAWRLEIDWVCQGKSGTLVVDDNGRPFEVKAEERPAPSRY